MYVCMHIFPICTVRTYVVCIPSDSIPYIDYLDNFMYVCMYVCIRHVGNQVAAFHDTVDDSQVGRRIRLRQH